MRMDGPRVERMYQTRDVADPKFYEAGSRSGVHLQAVRRKRGQLPLVCPECDFTPKTLEEFGIHLERHREMVCPAARFARAVRRSCRCSLCDRVMSTRSEFNGHLRLCDGSSPLPTRSLDRNLREEYILEQLALQTSA